MKNTQPTPLLLPIRIALIPLLSAALFSCKVAINEECMIQAETKKANNVVPLGPYNRTPDSWDRPNWIHKSGTRTPHTKFLITEFDEKGEPMIQAQLDDALAKIRSFKPQALILYVHGWHNDSSCRCEQEGGDMRDIDIMLDQMANPETGKAGLKTMAIYVGWRGETKLGLPRWFTLDDRREVARDIGESKSFQNFLGDVAAAGKMSGSNVVFVGHSLGAALMEKSACDMIVEKQKDDDARLPHLFVLANSAEKSNVSKVSIEGINGSRLVLGEQKGTTLTSPRVIAVTSLGDSADKILNPLNTILIKHKWPESTIGFDPKTRTHFLEKSSIWTADPKNLDKWLNGYSDPAYWAPERNRKPGEIKKSDGYRKYRMIPSGGEYARMPGFWNVHIPASISGNHNDVYNQSIVSASISWLGVAKNRNVDLEDVLKALKNELTTYPPKSEKFQERVPVRTQLVMGAATRMPDSEKAIGLLLGELERPEPAQRYRVNLFAILRFSHNAKVNWTKKNLDRLRALMNDESQRQALQTSGANDSGFWHSGDTNLKLFKNFMRSHEIRTP